MQPTPQPKIRKCFNGAKEENKQSSMENLSPFMSLLFSPFYNRNNFNVTFVLLGSSDGFLDFKKPPHPNDNRNYLNKPFLRVLQFIPHILETGKKRQFFGIKFKPGSAAAL